VLCLCACVPVCLCACVPVALDKVKGGRGRGRGIW